MTAAPSETATVAGSILLAGAGKMGGALLEGWLALGIEGRRVTVVDPHPTEALEASCGAAGVALNPPPGQIAVPDVLVLAVKPQALDMVAPSIAPAIGPQTLLLSVIAGKTMRDLAARLPHAAVILRAMPNTPAAVGRGITGVVANGPLSEAQRQLIDRLLQAVGRVEWLASEDLIDAVTAVSGSGPAYVFFLTECLAKAGEEAGLDAELARRLARATVEGAGELMFRTPGTTPEILRRNVTSPGGTTAAALEVLMGPQGMPPLVSRAVAAAQRRAKDLAG